MVHVVPGPVRSVVLLLVLVLVLVVTVVVASGGQRSRPPAVSVRPSAAAAATSSRGTASVRPVFGPVTVIRPRHGRATVDVWPFVFGGLVTYRQRDGRRHLVRRRRRCVRGRYPRRPAATVYACAENK